MRKGYLKYLILISAIPLFFGCNTKLKRLLGQIEDPQNEITIHEIVEYPMAKAIERQIPTYSGRKIWVNINYYTHSSVIKKIELVSRKTGEFYDLKLFLNRKGRMHWMSLSTEYRNKRVAFVINNVFYRSFSPRPLVGEYDVDDDSTYVLIEGPFDKSTAEVITEWAPRNYQFYNDDDDEF